MTVGNKLGVILGRIRSFPNKLGNKIPLSKHLIANLLQILYLVIINRNDNHPPPSVSSERATIRRG